MKLNENTDILKTVKLEMLKVNYILIKVCQIIENHFNSCHANVTIAPEKILLLLQKLLNKVDIVIIL
jgi:hypothetical protein